MTKHNPYIKWVLKTHKFSSAEKTLDCNWNLMNDQYVNRSEPVSTVRTRRGTPGNVDLWTLMSHVSYATGIGCENFSYLIAPIDFDGVEEGMKKQCQNPDQRAHLFCLPTLRNDPVARQLELFFNNMCREYPIDSGYLFDLPTNRIPIKPQDEQVLRDIAQAYRSLVTRTMRQKEYDYLKNVSYEDFVSKSTTEYLEGFFGRKRIKK